MRHTAAALLALVALAGCDRPWPGWNPAAGPPKAAEAPAAPIAVAAVPLAPAAAPAAPVVAGEAQLQVPVARERFHGGRTTAWWKDRLEVLQRQGPPTLYRLTLQRATAAGLLVVEGPPLLLSEAEEAR